MALSGFCASSGKFKLPPASRKDAANGSNPDSFQMAASLLELRMCENLHTPYKSRIYFLQLRSSPVCKPRWPSKPNVLGVLLPVQDPWAGETNPGFKTLPPWGELVQL